MIVTVSNINGIRQYQVPDNIRKIVFVSVALFVVFVATLVWGVVYLDGKVSRLSHHANREILQAKAQIETLQKSLAGIEQRYQALKEEKLSLEHNYLTKLTRLESEKHDILEKFKKAEAVGVVKHKKLTKKKEKFAALEKRLREIEMKLKKEKQLNSKLSKKSKAYLSIQKKLQALEKRLKKEVALNKKLSEKIKQHEARIAKLHQAGGTKKKRTKVADSTKSATLKQNPKRIKKIFSIAKKELGKRYVWGSVGPKTFDCSGFTSYVYKKVGIHIPRTSREQAKYGKLVERSQLKPGDLIFFDTDLHRKGIDHVGIYIGDNKFIHASSARKRVIVTSLNKSFYNQRFRLARRVN